MKRNLAILITALMLAGSAGALAHGGGGGGGGGGHGGGGGGGFHGGGGGGGGGSGGWAHGSGLASGGAAHAGFAHGGAAGAGFAHPGGFAHAGMHEHGEGMHDHRIPTVAQNQNTFNNGLNYYDSGRGLGFSIGHCVPLDPEDIGKDFDCEFPRKASAR